MKHISRREFIRTTAGVAVAVGYAGASAAESSAPKLTATTMRTLGKTDIQCSLIGMGTGVKSWNKESALTRKGHDAFINLLKHAYNSGIRYFDMADMYRAHPYMREVIEEGALDRDKLTLLTKTVSRKPDEVRDDIERFRKELNTDWLDIVMMHCLNEPDWPKKVAPCMDVLEDAKAKGLIRAHGLTTHSQEALEVAAENEWVDVVMARINPFKIKMDAEPEQVAAALKKARENGRGVLGMKIVGEGQCRDKIAESLKYVIGLGCVDAMPIGFLAPDEVDSAIAHVDAIAVS